MEPIAPCSIPFAVYESVYVVLETLPKLRNVKTMLFVFRDSFACEYPVVTDPVRFMEVVRVLGLAASVVGTCVNMISERNRSEIIFMS
jgi:hypothetical protein